MRLEDLRNPLPNIGKAYSPNFSNTTNESSDEKGAAVVSEAGILGLLKYLLPLSVPGIRDVIGNPLDPFGGEFDSNAGGENTGSPFDPTGGDPRWMWDPEHPNYNPTGDYGLDDDGGVSIDDPTPSPEYVPPMRDLDFGTFDGGLDAPSVGAPTG